MKHHRTYELSLWDTRVLRARESKPVDKTTYQPSMWSHILRQQLEVTADESPREERSAKPVVVTELLDQPRVIARSATTKVNARPRQQAAEIA